MREKTLGWEGDEKIRTKYVISEDIMRKHITL